MGPLRMKMQWMHMREASSGNCPIAISILRLHMSLQLHQSHSLRQKTTVQRMSHTASP